MAASILKSVSPDGSIAGACESKAAADESNQRQWLGTSRLSCSVLLRVRVPACRSLEKWHVPAFVCLNMALTSRCQTSLEPAQKCAKSLPDPSNYLMSESETALLVLHYLRKHDFLHSASSFER